MKPLKATVRFFTLAAALIQTFPALSSTLYVNASANCSNADGSATKPFCTIQAGVDAAVSGDTVQVAAGQYSVFVNVNNKGLRLLGENPNTTILAGSGTYTVTFSNVQSPASAEIANFTITGSSVGVYFGSVAQGYIHNCIITGNGDGVVAATSGVRVSNNVIDSSSHAGVYTSGSASMILNGNILSNNGIGAFAGGHCSGICDGRSCGESGGWYTSMSSSYNTYFSNLSQFANGYPACSTLSSFYDSNGIDPLFVDWGIGDYHLQIGSPAINAGITGSMYLDPDGTRNDQGVYGGPGAAAFWPFSAGRPVVTTVAVSPSNVATGGSFTIQATGQAQ